MLMATPTFCKKVLLMARPLQRRPSADVKRRYLTWTPPWNQKINRLGISTQSQTHGQHPGNGVTKEGVGLGGVEAVRLGDVVRVVEVVVVRVMDVVKVRVVDVVRVVVLDVVRVVVVVVMVMVVLVVGVVMVVDTRHYTRRAVRNIILFNQAQLFFFDNDFLQLINKHLSSNPFWLQVPSICKMKLQD